MKRPASSCRVFKGAAYAVALIIFLWTAAILYFGMGAIKQIASLFKNETTSREMKLVDIELYRIDAEGWRNSNFLKIPQAYLAKRAYWKGGSWGMLNLKAEWHSMQPWAIATDTHHEYDYRDGVAITLMPGYGKKANAQSSVAVYTNDLIDKGITLDGYHRYTPRDVVEGEKLIKHSEYNEMLIPLSNTEDDARVITCLNFKYGAGVGCDVKIFSDKINLLIEYNFSKKEFAHWREIDRNVLNFVESLKTDPEKSIQ